MKKTELVLGLLIVLLVLGLVVLNRQGSDEANPTQSRKSSDVRESVVPLTSVSATESNSKPRTNATSPQLADTVGQTNGSPENSLEATDARAALALVGIDDEADQFWLNAIFDTDIPDKDRADLMEDLNEVGFDDPKNITEDDLPLILNRLELIQAVLPDADDFMTEHLLEAEKDLVSMLASSNTPAQQ